MAVKKDLQIDQGATWCAVLCWKAGSPATPVDLTGCTARMHVRTQTNASDPPVRSLATGGQGITLGGVAASRFAHSAATERDVGPPVVRVFTAIDAHGVLWLAVGGRVSVQDSQSSRAAREKRQPPSRRAGISPRAAC